MSKSCRCIGCKKKIETNPFPLCLDCKVFLRFAINNAKSNFQNDLLRTQSKALCEFYKAHKKSIENGEPIEPIVYKGVEK